ncbi:MAG: LAGLIDADG family homing endonuclease [Actinobacteria bacterium]|nr:LAGLIDADG family homing endonuclease [Actinomycetota bacterium]
MGSDNPTGADNQQETSTRRLELDPLWVAGFVDGEGCFCVSVHRNPVNARRTGGWQLHPVFQVYQHQRHRAVLEELITFFGCGRLRPKGPRSSVITYAVDSMRSLEGSILPFFGRHPLVVKQDDFLSFAEIVRSMRRKEHLQPCGFERLVRLAYGMNADGKQRSRSIEEILGSSETVRQARRSGDRATVKIQSDLHGDMQSQAEMT